MERQGRSPAAPRMRGLLACLALQLVLPHVAAQASIDGGRGDLPGMKQDIFDQVQKNKKGGGPQHRGKGPPDCPKSDKMSPFFGLAFASGEVYVRLNSTEGQCQKLLTIAGANFSVLTNASRTCGPAGEWKNRIAEELSAVFFQGGLDWVKSENETLEVVTEEGTFFAEVSELKFAEQSECWKRGCGCEQANNPKMRMVFLAILVISVGGLSYDSVKLGWERINWKKPCKYVTDKKGNRMREVKLQYSHHCDVCGVAGTTYQSEADTNYDMCKKCYKEAKKKTKAAWKEWVAKHPEDEEKDKKDKKDKDDDDDDEKEKENEKEERETPKSDAEAESRSETESTALGAATGSKAASEAEQDEDAKEDAKEEEEDNKQEDEAKADGKDGN